MVASLLSPSPAVPTTVPNPNVSCDTRSPIANVIPDGALRPVARGGGAVATRGLRISDGEITL